MAFAPPPQPKSALGWHRILSPSAGLRVSPLCLGTMNFGDACTRGLVTDNLAGADLQTTFEILDFFFDNGGNFLDSANNYQGEESEEWIGEWMESRKNREQMVVETKYTTCYPSGKGGEKIKTNFQGNHSKSLRSSIEASLRKLRTSYIDLLYVHWWDFSTSIPELMQSLNHLVASGKVLYLDACDHALAQFCVYQGRWSAADRDFERDILLMAQGEGMALAPWGSLGGGNFFVEEKSEGRTMRPQTKNQKAASVAFHNIAHRKGTVITSVALAYVMKKSPYVFPIVGGRKVEHLKGNIEALGLELTSEEIEEIEDAVSFGVGFPYTMLFESFDAQKYRTDMGTGDMPLVKAAGYIDTVPKPKAIQGRKM